MNHGIAIADAVDLKPLVPTVRWLHTWNVEREAYADTITAVSWLAGFVVWINSKRSLKQNDETYMQKQ